MFTAWAHSHITSVTVTSRRGATFGGSDGRSVSSSCAADDDPDATAGEPVDGPDELAGAPADGPAALADATPAPPPCATV